MQNPASAACQHWHRICTSKSRPAELNARTQCIQPGRQRRRDHPAHRRHLLLARPALTVRHAVPGASLDGAPTRRHTQTGTHGKRPRPRLAQGANRSSDPDVADLTSSDGTAGRPRLGRPPPGRPPASPPPAAAAAGDAPRGAPRGGGPAGAASRALGGRPRWRLAAGAPSGAPAAAGAPVLASCLRGRPRLRRGRAAAAAASATGSGGSSGSGSGAAALANTALAAAALARRGGRSRAGVAGSVTPARPDARSPVRCGAIGG